MASTFWVRRLFLRYSIHQIRLHQLYNQPPTKATCMGTLKIRIKILLRTIVKKGKLIGYCRCKFYFRKQALFRGRSPAKNCFYAVHVFFISKCLPLGQAWHMLSILLFLNNRAIVWHMLSILLFLNNRAIVLRP